MRRFNNCTSSIIFVMILFFVWSLDCQNAMARIFYENGVTGSPSYTNGVDKENKMANYIKKWCQNESRESEKSMKDYENHDDLTYESSSHSRSSSKETQHLEARLLIEDKWSQANQIISMVATVGGSLFILVVVLMFCSKKPEEQEEIEDQHDEIIGLTQSPSEKIENSDDKDLGKCGPSFHISSIRQDNVTLDKQDVQEGSKDSNETPITAHVFTPPTPPPSRGPITPPPPVGGKGPPPPAPPLKGGKGPPPPPNLGNSGKRAFGKANEGTSQDAHRTKLKPFFWDKVLASPEQSMVWDEIRAGSFQFNEDMIESLFGYNPDEKKINDRRGKKADSSTTFIHIIDSKKAQNLSILLKALNVTTEEVSDALLEGQELPGELLQTLIRMAPTSEEELKLRLYSGDLSQIGPAERFLKVLVDIPFAFKRIECLLFMISLKEEASGLKESFNTLEAACDALKSSRLFLKILEAVLKTGNRMNAGTYRGSAQAFKLDTLLKLSDVKATDGKTNLLQFVIQEIIRTEGIKVARVAIEKYNTSNSTESDGFLEDSTTNSLENCRALGLQVVLSLITDLEVIKKAAIIDSDSLTSTVAKLGQSLLKTKDFLNREMHDLGEESRFYHALKDFVDVSESETTELLGEERRIMDLVKKTADYFQGSTTREDGLRIFVIVRDFLIVLEKTCVDIKKKMDQDAKTTNKGKSVKTTPQDSTPSSRGALDRNGQNTNHDLSSDNEASSSSQTSSTKEKPIKDGNDEASTSHTSSTKEELIEENISSTKEISMKDDNKILPLMRASSSSKGEQIIEDNEVLSLLRTYSVKGKSIQEDNEVSSFSRTSSTKGKLMIGDNKVLSQLRVSYNKEKLMKEDNEVASTSQTSSTKASSIKYDNEAPSTSQTSSMKQDHSPKKVLEDLDKKIPTKESQTELSSQESDRQTSSINDKKNKALTQENIIEEMRQKLFPTLQDSHFDESSSSSDDNDELQTSTKECLTKVSSHRSKVSPQIFQPQTSVDNKQMKQVSSYGKVIDDRQQRLFQGIQNRRLDDSSSDSSSGDDS